jgi:hypothetical protein
VYVTRNHLDGATWSPRHRGVPEFGWQMLDQKNGDAIAGFPSLKNRIS